MIGRSIVRRLLADGFSVRVLSRRDVPAHPGLSAERGDVTNLDDARRAVAGCAAVVHCAGERVDASRMERVNTAATQALFSLAADAQVTNFCHMSSVGVVGRTTRTVVDETTPCDPMNRYEETKRRAEDAVRAGLGGGTVVILRPTNVFAAETMRPWISRSMAARIRTALKGGERAHLVYVEDVAAAAVFALRTPPRASVEIYNVSSDDEAGNTVRDVQHRIAELTPAAPPPPPVSAPLAVPYWMRRARHGRTNRGDIVYTARKLRAAGFQFPYGLDAGLTEAVHQYSAMNS